MLYRSEQLGLGHVNGSWVQDASGAVRGAREHVEHTHMASMPHAHPTLVVAGSASRKQFTHLSSAPAARL